MTTEPGGKSGRGAEADRRPGARWDQRAELTGHEGRVRAVAFGEVDGHAIVASAGDDGTVRLWDAASEERRAVLTGHEGRVRAVAFGEVDGHAIVVSAGDDGTVRLWDGGNGAQLLMLTGHEGHVRGVAFGKVDGGPVVVSAGDDGTVRLWNGANGEQLLVLTGHEGHVRGVAFGEVDGGPVVVSAGDDGTVRLWDGADGEQRRVLTGHTGHVRRVAFGEVDDRPIVVSAADDGTVRLWDAASGEERAAVGGKERAGWRVAFSEVDGRPTIASAGNDGTVRLWDADSLEQRAELTGHEGHVRGLAFGRVDARPIVVSADETGTLRLWEAAATRPRGQVEWLPDDPATQDLLNRKPVADMLAVRLRRVAHSTHDPSVRAPASFLVHLDGPWGAGKTSILNFLRKELEGTDKPWLVVDFNAWQQARMGPAWWALLTALRNRVVAGVPRHRRWGLRAAEAWRRARATGAPYALALVLLLAAASAVILAVGPENVDSAKPEQVAKAVTAILAALAAIWAGALVFSRFILWDSAAGARLFEQSNRNPMADLRSHFGWLVQRTRRPVVFFIDDLDRCEQTYVVELLDGIQTLVRDAGKCAVSRVSTKDGGGAEVASSGPYFVVAADGAWIRTSYEEQHAKLAAAIAQPGRALGYLFLDKIFQLTVTVPSISMSKQRSYLTKLLESEGKDADPRRSERVRVEAKIRSSRTQAEVHQTWKDASEEVREDVGALAVEKLTDEAVQAETEHELQKFAPLLDRNPRRMKRFLNTYTADLVTTGLEDNFVEPDSLAVWAIFRMRWPTFADYLSANPDAIDSIGGGRPVPEDVDAGLRAAFNLREAREVVAFEHGGPLTAEFVRRLAGRSAFTKPTEGTPRD